MISQKLLLSLLAVIVFSSGCASQKFVGTRYVWPPQPNRARLEFLSVYSNQRDLSCRQIGLKDLLMDEENPASFDNPLGIAVSEEGRVYITDPPQSSVVVYDMKKCTVEMLGEPGILISPIGVTTDESGIVYVTDVTRKRVYVFDENGNALFSFGDDLKWPSGIAADKERNRIYVVDREMHCVKIFDGKGEHVNTIGEWGSESGKFKYPYGIALNSKGELIVADTMNARIQIFSPDGLFLRSFGQRGDGPMNFDIIKGVSVDSEDHIYITDAKAHKLMIFGINGEPLLDFYGRFISLDGAEALTNSEFTMPTGIDIDNNNTIYVVDTWNKRFQAYQYLEENKIKLGGYGY